MKRLTEWDEYGNADIIALSDMMPEIYAELSFSEANAMTDVLNLLGTYEDTELTPAEIRTMKTTLAEAQGKLALLSRIMDIDSMLEEARRHEQD